MVDHDCLMILAEPAAQLFVPEIAETLQRYIPKANVGEFFYLWTGFPEMNYWWTTVARRRLLIIGDGLGPKVDQRVLSAYLEVELGQVSLLG
jgi:hypothetical protein